MALLQKRYPGDVEEDDGHRLCILPGPGTIENYEDRYQ
jgi:hypothetical protein